MWHYSFSWHLAHTIVPLAWFTTTGWKIHQSSYRDITSVLTLIVTASFWFAVMMTSFHILPDYFFRLILNQFLSLVGTGKSKMTFLNFFFPQVWIYPLSKNVKEWQFKKKNKYRHNILLPLQKSWLLSDPESLTILFFHTCRCSWPLKIYGGSVDCGQIAYPYTFMHIKI